MSEFSDEEDSIDNIDFSVISTAIEAGGKTLDQILNAVHYGSPEVRHLLREACDFIFECKYCKNLFRSIPNFIAHKRIYCGEKSFFPRSTPKKKSKKKEEVVIVRPVSPPLSVPMETNSKEAKKTVLEQILTGSFQGTSEAYKHYTDAAENIERQKLNTVSTVVMTTSIKNTENAVNVQVVDMPDTPSNTTVSNASVILANAKNARKQPLTKIVDVLKKSANNVKVVTETSTITDSPKKLTEKNKALTAVAKGDNENIVGAIVVKGSSNAAAPSLTNSVGKGATKTENIAVQKPTEKVVIIEQKSGNSNVLTRIEKAAKIVLTPLSQLSPNLAKRLTAKEDVLPQKSGMGETVPSTKVSEKKEVSKATSSTDLRPVKSQDGSELSELSQLGHCDLNRLMCLICNLQYSQKKTLLQHMHVIHSGSKKKYPCNMCNKTFDYFWGLTRHLLLNHKKTKEEIDRMRPELRALAYTVTELEKNNDDTLSSDKPSSEDQESSIRASRTKQMTQALVKMNTCNGCNKSFWKKSNYEEHMKLCRFLSLMPSPIKVKSDSTSESINEKSVLNNLIMSRRQRTVEKLSESRKTIYESGEDDSSSVHSSLDNSSAGEERKTKAASKRLRVQGKFVSKEVALKILEQENKEKDEKIKEKEKKTNTAKSRVVQKLKEKSHSFVPAQLFISTRRSAAFYNSPAQRTRFHEKRRAVVSNAKKDTKSPSKSPTKSASESSEIDNESPAKNSIQEKSELEVARCNLLHAIEKVKKHDSESPERSVISGKRGSSAARSSLNDNKEEVTHSGRKENSDTLEIGRSRSAVRRKLSSSENSSERPKCSAKNAEKKTPSRDTSFDSTMSCESSRDTSSEHNSGNSTRSIQKVISEAKTGNNTCKSNHIPQKGTLEYQQTLRTRSRDTSKESSGGPTEKTSDKDDEKKGSGRSRSSTRQSRSDLTESRDSSKESVRTCSTENLTNMKLPPPRQSESQVKVVRTSPRSENSPKVLKSKDTDNNSSAKNPKATNQSPGKDEIDGLKLRDHSTEKRQPKWSSKNWDAKEDVLKGKEQSKNKCERQSSLNVKGKVPKGKEKGKGVIKHKTLTGKARYSTRSMKTRIQAAKKMGELKKRYSIRISSKKIASESHDSENKLTKVQHETDKKTPASKTVDKKGKPIYKDTSNKDNTNKKSGQNFKKDENTSNNYELCKKVDAAQQVDDENEEVKEQKITTYAHRQRHASDMQGVKVIEEIWVSKEPGKPLQNVKCKKTIIDSPKKLKASRMYVVDPIQPEKPKCMDFSRINHLVDYQSNKCLQCGIELSDISSLRRHAVRHLGWKRYKCKLCAYTGFNRSECNSHIKRRHAEKLITSSAPFSSFIIDLNKEASNVRNKKKQSTLQRKNTEDKKSTKTTTSQTECKPLRSSATKSVNEEENLKVEGGDIYKSHDSEISDSIVKEIQIMKKSRSNSGPAIVSPDRYNSGSAIVSLDKFNSGPAIVSPDDEARLTRKRKRAVSEEGPVFETKGDNLTIEPSNFDTEVQEQQRSENVIETKDTENEFDEEIRSVSDYEENGSEAPPRNVVSPTWTKMNPNVALMMATLEEARATKFARGKRGRGGIRRFSSPIKKQARSSTEDFLEQEQDCNEEEDDGKMDESKEIENDGKINKKDCAEKHYEEVQTDLSQTEGQSSDAIDELSSRKLDIVQSDGEQISNKSFEKVHREVFNIPVPSNDGVNDCHRGGEIVNQDLEENVDDKNEKNLNKELQTDQQTEKDPSTIQEISQNVKVDVEPGKNSISKQEKDSVEGSQLSLDKKVKAEKLEEESIESEQERVDCSGQK